MIPYTVIVRHIAKTKAGHALELGVAIVDIRFPTTVVMYVILTIGQYIKEVK